MADASGVVEREVEIINQQGLHARPVMRLADLLSNYQAEVRISKGDRSADPRTATGRGGIRPLTALQAGRNARNSVSIS